jgi:hypothetical protein
MATTAPNFYQLRGAQIHVTYSTTSIDGKPRFAYHDAHRALNFTGDEIRTTSTEIGTLVTVTLVRTVDVGFTTFTVLIPSINLEGTHPASISTEGITTVHRTSLLPAVDRDQTELYSVTPLTGTARIVEF